MKDFTNIVFISDLHIPYENKKDVELVKKFLEDFQPEILVLGGDILDFMGLSRFSRDPKRALTTQDDIDKVSTLLLDLRIILPYTEFVYLEGNHEYRMVNYKWTKCPELSYIRALELPTLLHFKDIGIRFIPYSKFYSYKKLFFVHGDVISKHSGQTAKSMLDKWGVNIICGHSHRTGKCNRTTLEGNKGAWESGCLCDLNPDYIKGKANWQSGFSVVEYYKDKVFYVNNIDIIDHTFIHGGKYFTLDK
jgi:UDP-2,3-diacylglucosamine pyrophosphatase LpxH